MKAGSGRQAVKTSRPQDLKTSEHKDQESGGGRAARGGALRSRWGGAALAESEQSIETKCGESARRSPAIAKPELNVLSVFAATARTVCGPAPGAAIDHELGASRDSAIALHDTWGVAKLRIVARTKIALIEAILSFYDESLLFEMGAHPIAQFPLQFHAIFGNRPATPACFLQLAAEGFQERLVVRQAKDHGDGLAAAAFLFHAQLGDDAIGNRLFTGCERLAALAIGQRPATLRTGTAAVSGVNEPGAQLGMKVNRARPLAVPLHGQSDEELGLGRASARTST